MAWNEPGGNRDDDPWGKRRKNEGPPDLDEMLKKMQKKFKGFFGGGGSGRKGSGGGGGMFGFSLLIIVAVIVWLASGFYTVKEGQKAVILRFGKFNRIATAGLNFNLPYPIETREIVDVAAINSIEHKAVMLTKDERLVQIDLNIQFRVGARPEDVKNFLFQVKNPIKTLGEAVESALREAMGKRTLEEVLGVEALVATTSKSKVRCRIQYDKEAKTEIRKLNAPENKGNTAGKDKKVRFQGRGLLAKEVKEHLDEILKSYNIGIVIKKVNFKKPSAPNDEVAKAFEDVNRAKQDSTRYIERAWAYCAEVVNRAEGQKSKLVKEAEAYKEEKVLNAKGEVSRYLKILSEYEKAPEVVRKRMYLETQERILSRVNKILVKSGAGNNVMLLPLDKYLKRNPEAPVGSKLKQNNGN